jgi:hypothetical protein
MELMLKKYFRLRKSKRRQKAEGRRSIKKPGTFFSQKILKPFINKKL